MKVNYAHLCDYASMSADGKVSLMGLFGVINAANLPAVITQSFLVFEIELDYAELGTSFESRVQCVDQDGQRILEARAQVTTQGKAKPGDHPTVVQILRLPPIALKRAGPYDINIFLGANQSLQSRVSFQVRLIAPPAAPPIQGKPPLIPPPGET